MSSLLDDVTNLNTESGDFCQQLTKETPGVDGGSLRLLQEGEPFPLKTSTHVYKPDLPEGQTSSVEAGGKVDIVITHFSDRLLIIVTDTGNGHEKK